jgi:ribosomal RNA assembly protein
MQNQKELEDKLGVKILIRGTQIEITGKEEIDEYFASRVLEALDYRFLVEDALFLKDEKYDFKVLHIKDHTTRSDLGVIRGRIIGLKGKTLKVISDLTGCELAVRDNEVAIIGPVERMHEAEEAVIALIKGSKQGNVYAHLEKLNRGKRKWKD